LNNNNTWWKKKRVNHSENKEKGILKLTEHAGKDKHSICLSG